MPGYVLEEDEGGCGLGDDPGDIGPEVAGVVGSTAVSAKAEGLAGITGSDDMNAAAPRAAVEGSQIVPDRSRSQGRVCHPRHESGCGETVSLDMTYSAVSGHCDVQAEIKASDTGAKADAAKIVMSLGGMKSHTRVPRRRWRARAGGSSVASGD